MIKMRLKPRKYKDTKPKKGQSNVCKQKNPQKNRKKRQNFKKLDLKKKKKIHLQFLQLYITFRVYVCVNYSRIINIYGNFKPF